MKGMKQRAERCHKGNATAHGPEPPHINPTLPIGAEGSVPRLAFASGTLGPMLHASPARPHL
eukprot:289601-Chlamydomonas_euryale.AAC.1